MTASGLVGLGCVGGCGFGFFGVVDDSGSWFCLFWSRFVFVFVLVGVVPTIFRFK